MNLTRLRMTTFTTEDRLEAEKNDPELVPIPFAGWMRFEPVVIVESGASVMFSVEEPK